MHAHNSLKGFEIITHLLWKGDQDWGETSQSDFDNNFVSFHKQAYVLFKDTKIYTCDKNNKMNTNYDHNV